MNIRALRYCLIDGAKGIKSESTTGPIRQILLRGVDRTDMIGALNAGYTYDSSRYYADDFWIILNRNKEPKNAVHENSRQIQVHS